jgi:hypothetical protein
MGLKLAVGTHGGADLSGVLATGRVQPTHSLEVPIRYLLEAPANAFDDPSFTEGKPQLAMAESQHQTLPPHHLIGRLPQIHLRDNA